MAFVIGTAHPMDFDLVQLPAGHAVEARNTASGACRPVVMEKIAGDLVSQEHESLRRALKRPTLPEGPRH